MTIGAKIAITGELAIAIGKLAAEKHGGDAVVIVYDTAEAEQLWRVTFDDGAQETGRYVINDETGDVREVA